MGLVLEEKCSIILKYKVFPASNEAGQNVPR